MITLVALLPLLMTGIFVQAANPKCHMQEAMDCLDIPISFLNSLPKRSIPVSMDEVTNLCSALTQSFQCWDTFKKNCMTPIQKELEVMIMEGVRTLKDDFCADNSELKQNYLKHSQCLNEVATSDETTQNLQYMMAIFEKFLKLPDNQKFPYICCGYDKVYNQIRQSSLDACGEEATTAGEELISMAVAQLPNVVCQSFEGEGKECQSILPADGTKPSGSLKDNVIYKYVYDSFQNYLE